MSKVSQTELATHLPQGIGDVFIHATHVAVESAQSHPVVGIAVGGCAVVGAFAEMWSVRRIAKNSEPLVSEWDVLEPAKHGFIRRGLKHGMSLAAVGGAFIGAANAYAWESSASQEVVPPALQVVVDKSGATLANDQQAANAVGNILGTMQVELDEFTTTAWVTSSGGVEQMPVDEAIAEQPFGDATMSAALGLSLDQAINQRNEQSLGDEVQGTAIAVLTNGNRANASTLKLEAANTPVYVFDVAEDSSNERQLTTLAEDTGGEYFSIDDFNDVEGTKAAIDLIKENTSPSDKDSNNKTDWVRRVVVGLLSFGSVTKWMRERRTYKTGMQITPAEHSNNLTRGKRVLSHIPVIGKKVRR